jgi:uncharacterized membrane protein HdeD (DUF308 family)
MESTLHPASWQRTTELDPLIRNWRLLAARGVLAILLGICMVLWRVPTLQAIIVPFAVYALADGLLAIASALRTAGSRLEGWPILFEGIVSLGLGVVALFWPFVPYRAIVALVVWGVLTGIFEIVAALRLPRELAAHWLVATGGISSIFLSLLVLGLPGAGLDRMAFWLAGYAIVFGIAILLAARRLALRAPGIPSR